MIDKEELCRLMKKIEQIPCVASENETSGMFGNFLRVDSLDEEIRNSTENYGQIDGTEYYRLYGQADLKTLTKKYKRVLLVSSHADNLQTKSSFSHEMNSEYLHGCFDNASTNAIAVYLMKYMKLPGNVLFAFTADEERESEGAKHVSERLAQSFGAGNADVIVLDVTYGLQGGVDFTIENDYIFEHHYGKNFVKRICDVANHSEYTWNFLKKEKEAAGYIDSHEIRNSMKEGCKAYLEVEGPDETTEYQSHGFSTFSLCLPCTAENESQMHSEDGFEISMKTACRYLEVLYGMLKMK